MTATVETVSEQLDLAAIIPAEKVVSAVARAITLSETDVGKYPKNSNRNFKPTLSCRDRSSSQTPSHWRKRRTS